MRTIAGKPYQVWNKKLLSTHGSANATYTHVTRSALDCFSVTRLVLNRSVRVSCSLSDPREHPEPAFGLFSSEACVVVVLNFVTGNRSHMWLFSGNTDDFSAPRVMRTCSCFWHGREARDGKKILSGFIVSSFCDGEVKVIRKRQVLFRPNQEGDVRKMLRWRLWSLFEFLKASPGRNFENRMYLALAECQAPLLSLAS